MLYLQNIQKSKGPRKAKTIPKQISGQGLSLPDIKLVKQPQFQLHEVGTGIDK